MPPKRKFRSARRKKRTFTGNVYTRKRKLNENESTVGSTEEVKLQTSTVKLWRQNNPHRILPALRWRHCLLAWKSCNRTLAILLKALVRISPKLQRVFASLTSPYSEQYLSHFCVHSAGMVTLFSRKIRTLRRVLQPFLWWNVHQESVNTRRGFILLLKSLEAKPLKSTAELFLQQETLELDTKVLWNSQVLWICWHQWMKTHIVTTLLQFVMLLRLKQKEAWQMLLGKLKPKWGHQCPHMATCNQRSLLWLSNGGTGSNSGSFPFQWWSFLNCFSSTGAWNLSRTALYYGKSETGP